MKKILLLGGIVALMLSSCVSLSEMETLQANYDKSEQQLRMTRDENSQLKVENSELNRQNQSLNADMTEMAITKHRCEQTVDSLSRRLEQLYHHYDTTMENYVQEVAGKSRDLARAQNLLMARTKELNDKERELQARQAELQEQQESFKLERSEFLSRQTELIATQRKLQEEEAATRAKLEAKERELESVRNRVTQALTGFADKGLNIETRNGKVYVSMENKLLFPSASWTVSNEGANAIKNLAKVLEQDSTLNIMVEGHTDNDAYRGSTAVKDNWDLSVMRATAIVKLLTKYGPNINPSRIEACGHGEFAPKVANDTPAHKAMNRRTEIILTPNIGELLEEIQN